VIAICHIASRIEHRDFEQADERWASRRRAASAAFRPVVV